MSSKNEVKNDDRSEVKIYKIREELSLALNNWQDIESNPNKAVEKKDQSVPSPRKKKLLKEIKLQLESL